MWNKKLVTIVTEKAIESNLEDSFKDWGIKGYTITDARGKGNRGVRSAVWDQAANIRIEVVTDGKMAELLCERLKAEYYDNYAMILFTVDVQTLRDDKF
ncbi:MAG: transcriptional regulator [Verrucomicrobiota bacterium]|nr:transcriptional regulator [Verrucomicrobiota bacterium]